MEPTELIDQKTDHYDKMSQAMAIVAMPDGTVPERVARCCQVLAHEGHGAGLAGQITARDETQPNTFWTQSVGLALTEATADNQNLISHNVELIEGPGPVNMANRFHGWIYAHRPEVNGIVHTHALYSAALSMIGEPLQIAQMDVMPLYDDVAWLSSWPGVPYGNEEGQIIMTALGDKRAILLAHHGLLTTGRSVEEASYLATVLEHAARLHLLARSAGTICAVLPELGADARRHALSERYALAHFNAIARQLGA